MATRWYIGVSGNTWNNTLYWSATSGGPSGASVPTTGDDVRLDKDWGAGGNLINVNSDIGQIASLTFDDTGAGTVGSLYLAGTTTTNSGSAWSISAPVTIAVNSTINTEFLALNNSLTGTAKITKTGSGNLLFNQPVATAVTWSGGIDITSGTLILANADNKLGTGDVTLSSGVYVLAGAANRSVNSPFVIAGDVYFSTTSPTYTTLAPTQLTLSGTVFFASSVRQLSVGSGNLVVSGAMSGVGFIKAGTGTMTVSNANASFSGSVEVAAGTLTNTNTAAFDASAVTLSGGTYQPGVASTVIGSLAGTSGTFNVANNTSVGADNTNAVFGAVISGSSSLTKTGTGRWTLAQSSTTYSGAITVSAGELYTTNNTVPGVALTVSANAKWAAYSPTTPTRATLGGGLTLAANTTVTFGSP